MKKNIFLTVIIISYAFFAFSQDKKINKISDLYANKEYDKCIEKSEKYNKKNTKQPETYYYIGLSFFQKSKQETAHRSNNTLQRGISKIVQATKKDEDRTVFATFQADLDELHDTILTRARRYDNTRDQDLANTLFRNLVEIYNDTTPEYRDKFIPKPPCWKQQLAYASYSGLKNQTDMKGLKQGLWVKRYESGCIMYEINFKDGKPVGDYRRYHENGELKAKMYFNDRSDTATAILYNEKGMRVAMGYYVNQKKDSIWQYFRNDSILIKQENYKNGVLHGKEYTLSLMSYPNVLEEKTWVNGVEHGVWNRFFYNQECSKQFESTMKNGKREGLFKDYYPSGNIKSIGYYKNGKEEGEWKYYSPDRKETIIIYHNGIAENQEELDRIATEEIEKMQEERGKFRDPLPMDFEGME